MFLHDIFNLIKGILIYVFFLFILKYIHLIEALQFIIFPLFIVEMFYA